MLKPVAYIATPRRGKPRLVFAESAGHRNAVLFGEELQPLVVLETLNVNNSSEPVKGSVSVIGNEVNVTVSDAVVLNDPALQTWFGLSRASFAVLPRVFMEAMPVEWQAKMGALLHEYSETIDTSAGDVHTCEVVAKNKQGRYVSLPEDILNYRHPNPEFIASIKK